MKSDLADKTKMLFNNCEMAMSQMALRMGLNLFDIMSGDGADIETMKDLLDIYQDAKGIYVEQMAVTDHIVEQTVETNDRLVELLAEMNKLRSLLEETNRMVKKVETKA